MTDEPVDDLVSAYLRRQSEQTDPHAGLRRVRATLAAAPVRRFNRRRWLTAAAAVLLGGVGAGLYLGSDSRASAETVLRQIQLVHAQPVDRCYVVESKVESDVLDQRHPLWAAVRQTRLWTRGDRFWISSGIGARQWNWGRDEDGRLWLTFPANWGIRYDRGETPEQLALLCDLYSMKVETLLAELLADFDLRWEDAAPGTLDIRAEPKPGHRHPTLRWARLVIDAETKVLQRIELSRNFNNRAISHVTYTLTETQHLPDGQYQIEGHLTPPYQIFSRTFEPQRRRQLLLGRFGQRAFDPPAGGENR